MNENSVKIEHLGTVRGGSNGTARLHLNFRLDDATPDELRAAAQPLLDSLEGMRYGFWIGVTFQIDSRREFALVPLLIRRFMAMGFRPAISQWDVQCKAEVFLDADPASFWREIALAQAWFEK